MPLTSLANAEAVEHYTRALEADSKLSADEASIGITATSTEQLTHLYARRGRALELNAGIQEAVDNYEAMRQKAQQLDAKEMELAALMSMATQYATPTSIYSFELAESLSQQALQLAQELTRLSELARERKLGVEELSGSTFTITLPLVENGSMKNGKPLEQPQAPTVAPKRPF